MGSTFTMASKPKNRQPGKGDSPAARIDVATELAKLPSGFAFATASVEARQRVCEIAAALLAEETVFGLSTSRAQFIELTRSHALRAGESNVRRQIESALASDRFLKDRAGEIERLPEATAEAERALERAAAAAAKAAAARDAAQTALAVCKGLAIQAQEARRAIAPTDPVVRFALNHVRALCAE